MLERDSRTAMLIGEDALNKLKASRVAVFGVGGVGGHAVDALVRAGVGEIDLFDNDTVSESNINRQLIATYETLGEYKTEAFERRIKTINPDCRVNLHTCFVTSETVEALDLSVYDYIIDAIDTVSTKIALAVKCEKEEIRIMSSMGTGNKLDPTRFEVSDIYKTSVCPLARVMRSELRRRGVTALKVLYSKEEPSGKQKNDTGMSHCEEKRTKIPPASISFVPAAAGLIIAGEVIKDIIGVNI